MLTVGDDVLYMCWHIRRRLAKVLAEIEIQTFETKVQGLTKKQRFETTLEASQRVSNWGFKGSFYPIPHRQVGLINQFCEIEHSMRFLHVCMPVDSAWIRQRTVGSSTTCAVKSADLCHFQFQTGSGAD